MSDAFRQIEGVDRHIADIGDLQTESNGAARVAML